MGLGKYWGTFGAPFRFEHYGWRIEIAPFTYTAPEEWRGMVAYRYRMSRNAVTPGVWRDRNPRGRKFETRCFTSMQKAKDAAIAEVAT